MITIIANCEHLPSPQPSMWGKLDAPGVDLSPRCSLPIAFPTNKPSQGNNSRQNNYMKKGKPTVLFA